jgi:hypothetical protein
MILGVKDLPYGLAGFVEAYRYVALGLPHVPEEYEAILPDAVGAAALLIPAHGFEDGLDVHGGNLWRKAGGAEEVFVEFDQIRAELLARQAGGGEHPDGDRLAVGRS